jgi:NADH-quinone oxidoreductase subunit G
VKELKVPLVDCAPVAHKLSEDAALVARSLPGEPITDATIASIGQLVAGNEGPVVVVLGRGSVAESAHATLRTAALLSALPNVRFLSALRRGNVHGALDAGLAPGFLPGRVSLAGGATWFRERWGNVPAATGLDAEGILRAAAEGKIHVLVLLGADPCTDFPDAALAKRGIDGASIVVSVDAFVPEGARVPDVFLPCTVQGEKTGTVTNLEGRVQRVSRKVAPEGTAMDDWRIAGEIAFRMGHDFDLATVDEVTDEIARVAPAALGATAALMRRARDGVVLPLREHLGEVVVRTRELSIMSEDGQGMSWDPIKVEGETPDDAAAVVEEAAAEALTPPPPPEVAPDLHTWDKQVASTSTPPRDAYALRLVSGRQLYDAGRSVQESLLNELAREPELRVSPHDIARLGVETRSRVRVTSSVTTLELFAVADDRVPAGVASLAFAGDADGAAKLIDVSAPVTDLRVETVS